MDVKIITNGTKVVIKDVGLKGTVIGVSMCGINNSYIEYRIIYWNAGSRQDDWLFDWEIEVFENTKKKAGMVNYETDTSKLIE